VAAKVESSGARKDPMDEDGAIVSSRDVDSPAVSGDHFSVMSAASLNPWWRIADFGVLGLWVVIVGFTIQHHEKWADEAQAWLIARDLDLRTIWFHELRYEGSPGLWHTILWVAQRVFHARYDSIGYIGMAFATAGVALVLFKAPLPRPLRWLLVFSYFMVYQYAVIARPYTLLPLLAFVAAILFKDIRHPERITVVLVLLANVSLHGTIIAGCLGLAYLIDGIKSWATLEPPVRRRYVLCVAAMAITFLFLFVILKPTPDVEVFVVKKDPAKYHIVEAPKLAKVESIVSGAFLDYFLPSAAFWLLVGAWCFMRRRLLTFALPTALLILLYTMVRGAQHHHGTLFVAAITGLWIAWPTEEERQAFTVGERRATQGLIALLVCLFGLNIWDAAVAIRHDYLYPYSGAEDAANYLLSAGAISKPLFGYMYGAAGVQAYFDHNILSNMSTTYYHHGEPLQGRILDWEEISRVKPGYLIIHSENPQSDYRNVNAVLNSQGYKLARLSDGYTFFKRSVDEHQAYLIYRRVGP
jgi:hypothetical protein